MILNLQFVTTLDISRFIRRCDNTFSTDQTSMFVDYEILSVNAFSDNNVCTDDTILKNGTFFDCTSTSDNTVLNSSFDQTSVGNNRGCNLAAFEILCRARVICTCINRPVIMEQICCFLQIDQIQVCLIIAVEV